jgi:hypothetical protein
MDLLISLGNLAIFIDPQERVLDLIFVLSWLMDTNMDWQLLSTSFFLETANKLAIFDRFDECN